MVTKAYIGLGSNVGDRIKWHQRAVAALAAHSEVQVVAQSRYYESPALLPDNAPAEWNSSFINQVIAIETTLNPLDLLAACQQAEASLGRQKTGRWGPREIDIDILVYGDEWVNENGLSIPHAEMTKRDFVLLPLRDVAPDWVYPAGGNHGGQRIDALCAALSSITATPVDSHDA